jgi:hypothetical protein
MLTFTADLLLFLLYQKYVKIIILFYYNKVSVILNQSSEAQKTSREAGSFPLSSGLQVLKILRPPYPHTLNTRST